MQTCLGSSRVPRAGGVGDEPKDAAGGWTKVGSVKITNKRSRDVIAVFPALCWTNIASCLP